MLSPGDRLGPYEVVSPLGAGGMGEVYRARDTRLGREVAVKVVREAGAPGPERLRRFEAEARAVAALSHPNVLTLHDVGAHEGRPYLVLELLEGETLRARLERGPLPPRRAVEIAIEASRGLEAAHARGIVHRDLKPENLFLTNDGRTKVLDFGLAHAVLGTGEPSPGPGETGTAPGILLGTVGYLSPEQARGRAAESRSDVFALGAVLYEMLSGRRAFSGPTPADTLAAVLERDPPPLSGEPGALSLAAGRIVRRCLAKEPDERFQSAHDLGLALEAVHGDDGPSAGAEVAEKRSPYPGLASFGERDAALFLGREADVEALWGRIRARRLLAVIGPSGAGKTSFVRAGVVPARPAGWAALVTTPGTAPFTMLGQALAPHLAGDAEALRQLVRFEDPDVAFAVVDRWRRLSSDALLVVDQLEELFTLNPRDVQAAFVRLVGRLAAEADVHVVLVLRDDFLMRCQEHEALTPVFSELTPLGPLTGASLRRAFEEPARDAGFRFEEGLLETMLAEVEGERGALPLLAFAVARLWERRDAERRLLTRAAWAETGGVTGALARHAEATLERIGTGGLPTVREIFRNLVTAQGTRAVATREEVVSVFPDPVAAGRALDALVSARLVTAYEAGPEGEAGPHRVEIVHESLLRSWPRLVRWQAQDAEGALLRDQLRQAARLWDEKGRPEDLLWTGASFLEYRAWRARYAGSLSAAEESFARAMTALAGRRRRRRRAAVLAGFAATAALLTIVTALWRGSEAERRRAEASRLLALGQLQLDEFPTLALAYATASLEQADSEEGRLFALRAAHRGPPAMLLEGTSGDGTEAHTVAFSRDGAWLAVGGYRKVRLFRREGGPPVVVAEHPAAGFRVVDAAFAPAGEPLVTVHDGQVRAWTVPGGRELWGHQPDRGPSYAIVRGDRLFTVTGRRLGDAPEWVLREWDWTTGASRLVGVADGLGDLDDTPGQYAYQVGRRILARSFDRWSSPRVVAEHEADVAFLRVSPDGQTVAAADSAREAIRLGPIEGRPPGTGRRLPAPGGFSVEFDEDGKRLASRSVDGMKSNVRVWDLEAPEGTQPVELRRNDQPFLNDLDFTPDGRQVVVAYAVDVAFWPLAADAPRVLAGHEGLVQSLAFTPDGRTLLSVSGDGTLRAWPVGSRAGAEPRVLLRTPMAFPGLAIDPVSPRLAVTGRGGRVFVVPLDGGPARALEGFSERTEIVALAFSPDGRRLAAAPFLGPRSEKVVRVWDVESGTSQVFGPFPGTGEGYEGAIWRVRFLSEDRLLAVVGTYPTEGSGRHPLALVGLRDGRVRVLDPPASDSTPGLVETLLVSRDGTFALGHEGASETSIRIVRFPLEGGAVTPLASHGNRVLNVVALDPTETTVATASVDGTIRVGPLSGEEPHLLLGHHGHLRALCFSPDGRWLASAGEDRLIRLWPVPDVSRPPLHRRPREELLAVLRSWTNLRVVPDARASDGYRVERAPFPGWGRPPGQ